MTKILIKTIIDAKPRIISLIFLIETVQLLDEVDHHLFLNFNFLIIFGVVDRIRRELADVDALTVLAICAPVLEAR